MKGTNLKKVSKILSKEYDVKEDTIKRDWRRRETWLPKIYQLEDAELILSEILAEHREIHKELWELKEQTDHEPTKLGVLKTLQESNKILIEILQSIGRIREEPKKIKSIEDPESEKVLKEIKKRAEKEDFPLDRPIKPAPKLENEKEVSQ